MKRSALLALAALAAIALLVWLFRPGASGVATPASDTARPHSVASTPPATPPAQSKTLGPPPDPSSPDITERARVLNSPATDVRTDLRLVSDVIETFRTNFPRDGNPVGSNAEITAVLTGKNKLRFAFLPPNHPAINRAGELCDRWGTPFFFHAESAHRMEIRSAGPDKKMWNDDDAVLTP